MQNTEEYFPRQIKIQSIVIWSLITLFTWIAWSTIFIAILFFLSWNIDLEVLKEWTKKTSVIVPIILNWIVSFIWAIVSLVSYSLTIKFWQTWYKKNLTTVFHILFSISLISIFFLPIYIYVWITNFPDILLIISVHCLFIFLLFNIILELLNNYNYVFLWLYWSIAWTILTIFIIIFISFYDFSRWKLYLISMIFPLFNFLNYFFKELFKFLYYKYYFFTWSDPIWMPFYSIKREEKEDYNF